MSTLAFRLPKNPQIYQTIFLLCLINLGILFFGLHLDYTKLAIIFASCIGFDMLFSRISWGEWRWPYSGVNVGFGISFFLRTDILILYVIAAFLGIISKHIFRINGRHFFNPSNFGVFVTLVCFPLITWTNPLQWTKVYDYTWQFYLILGLIMVFGALIIWRVRVWMGKNLLWLVLPFMVTHVIAYFLFGNDGSWISLTKWYTPAFLIFTFFMLTDPQIAPDNNITKMGFAINVGILPYILQYFINENYSLFAGLFLMTLTLPIAHYLDAKDENKKYSSWSWFYICLFVLLLIFLLLCIYVWFGPMDLVFDNRCRQLFCLES